MRDTALALNALRVRPSEDDPMRSQRWLGSIADPAAQTWVTADSALGGSPGTFAGLAQAVPSSSSMLSNIRYTTGPKSLSNTYTASSVMGGK